MATHDDVFAVNLLAVRRAKIFFAKSNLRSMKNSKAEVAAEVKEAVFHARVIFLWIAVESCLDSEDADSVKTTSQAMAPDPQVYRPCINFNGQARPRAHRTGSQHPSCSTRLFLSYWFDHMASPHTFDINDGLGLRIQENESCRDNKSLPECMDIHESLRTDSLNTHASPRTYGSTSRGTSEHASSGTETARLARDYYSLRPVHEGRSQADRILAYEGDKRKWVPSLRTASSGSRMQQRGKWMSLLVQQEDQPSARCLWPCVGRQLRDICAAVRGIFWRIQTCDSDL